jgi:hypothetical protein
MNQIVAVGVFSAILFNPKRQPLFFMARVKKNIVTEGLSGKLGDRIVFRTRGGRTFVAVAPTPVKREPTEAQKQQRRKFAEANSYAKRALEDPTLKAAYRAQAKEHQSAFNAAMGDFLNAPAIDHIDSSEYDGKRGSQLRLSVSDDTQVASVRVAIYDPQGALLEEGDAQLAENNIDWVYTAQKAVAEVKGSKVAVQASDLPGNRSRREEVL